jgi:hypothetical protein
MLPKVATVAKRASAIVADMHVPSFYVLVFLYCIVVIISCCVSSCCC